MPVEAAIAVRQGNLNCHLCPAFHQPHESASTVRRHFRVLQTPDMYLAAKDKVILSHHLSTPTTTMSELQRIWARSKVGLPNDTGRFNDYFNEVDEETEADAVADLPEHVDDDSSSASSVSSTGTIIPSPNQKLFARPQGYAHLHALRPLKTWGLGKILTL